MGSHAKSKPGRIEKKRAVVAVHEAERTSPSDAFAWLRATGCFVFLKMSNGFYIFADKRRVIAYYSAMAVT